MNRRVFLSAAPAVLLPFRAQAHSEFLNVVLILADDLGYNDLGCYGCADIATPHLNRLARQGARLTDCYTSAPVCSPTRCALLTGRYQDRLPGFEWVISPDRSEIGLHPSVPTVAMMLQKVGYKTALYGKWHLGYREEFHPNRHGFDEFFGFLGGNIDYFTHRRIDGTIDLYENADPIEAEGYFTDLVTERSVRFIQDNARRPFFLYAAYNAPHYPIQGPLDRAVPVTRENWTSRGERADYARMVERLDDGVGQILLALKKQGLQRNTLVIFTSDNGGERLAGNLPLSGQKGHLREGGIRVPCLFSWPGVIPAGKRVTQPTITMDLTTTLLDSIGLNPIRPLDGMSLMRHLASDADDVQTTFFWDVPRHNERAVRWGKWKWLHEQDQDLLFDLEEDPGETQDIKNRFIDIVFELQSQHGSWRRWMNLHQQRFRERTAAGA